nr:hypothetical protein [Hydrocarboniphaga sp.]
MSGRLHKRVAIITGAGCRHGWGNGKATAVLFAREGARLLLVDRDADALAQTHAAILADSSQRGAISGGRRKRLYQRRRAGGRRRVYTSDADDGAGLIHRAPSGASFRAVIRLKRRVLSELDDQRMCGRLCAIASRTASGQPRASR